MVERLYNDGRGVVSRSKPMWEPMRVLVRGPDANATATECDVEGVLKPTAQWFRINSVAMDHLRRHAAAFDTPGEGRPIMVEQVSKCATECTLDLFLTDGTEVNKRLQGPLATLLLATQVMQSGWADGGLKFRDRFSRRASERAVEDACRAVFAIQQPSG